MRFARVGLILCVLFLAVPGWTQQTTSTQTPQSQLPAKPPARDPQAVSILTNALNAAGGSSTIAAITDYTATGNVNYSLGEGVQGSVTVMSLGLTEFRLDANLPLGVLSWSIHDGQLTMKRWDGFMSQYPRSGVVSSAEVFRYEVPMFSGSILVPALQIAAVLNDTSYSLTFKGLTQIDGKSVNDVQIQRVFPGMFDPLYDFHTRDIFIDSSTLQVVMTQDAAPRNFGRQIQYSAYTSAGGIVVPFSVAERVGSQLMWEIQLTNIQFNSGLQATSFEIQ